MIWFSCLADFMKGWMILIDERFWLMNDFNMYLHQSIIMFKIIKITVIKQHCDLSSWSLQQISSLLSTLAWCVTSMHSATLLATDSSQNFSQTKWLTVWADTTWVNMVQVLIKLAKTRQIAIGEFYSWCSPQIWCKKCREWSLGVWLL